MTLAIGIGIFLVAVLIMRLGGDPDRENQFDKLDKMIAETKFYELNKRNNR